MKNYFVTLFTLASILLSAPATNAAEPLWQGKGRIAISSDGNEHDDDDWAATPVSLAILANKGLQKHLCLYTYSDHVWGSNHTRPNKFGHSAYDHMKLSAEGSKEWFDFNKSEFICAVDDPERAYEAMAREVNRSSAKNPLFIIAAGPMQVVGEGLSRADRSKLKYVTVISHSTWNDNHSDKPSKAAWDDHTGWTWREMQAEFTTAKFIKIIDQNGKDGRPGLLAPREQFDWIKELGKSSHKRFKPGAFDFLYSRVETCQKRKNRYFDISDAGMTLYLITGEEDTNMPMLETFFRSEQ